MNAEFKGPEWHISVPEDSFGVLLVKRFLKVLEFSVEANLLAMKPQDVIAGIDPIVILQASKSEGGAS